MSIYTLSTFKPLKIAVFVDCDILQVAYRIRRVYRDCTDCIYERATVVYMRVHCIYERAMYIEACNLYMGTCIYERAICP